SSTGGLLRIIAARTATHTISFRWLMPWCSKVTMPVPGRDRDRRASTTSVTTWMVSPVNTGAGNSTLEKPRLATVVPRVSSGTASPTTSATVNMLLTRIWPNSVVAANSASRCSGCGFMVMVVNSTLSVSVTVRVVACRTWRPGHVLQGAGVALRLARFDHVPEQPPHDLAGAGLGQRGGQVHRAEPGVAAELGGGLAGYLLGDLARVGPVEQGQEGHRHRALGRVGHPDHRRLGHLRVGHGDGLDLQGGDPVRGHVDHVVGPAQHPQVAVVVQHGLVV